MDTEKHSPALVPTSEKVARLSKRRDALIKKIEDKRIKLGQICSKVDQAKRAIANASHSRIMKIASLEFDLRELFTRVLKEKKLSKAQRRIVEENQKALVAGGFTKGSERDGFEDEFIQKIREKRAQVKHEEEQQQPQPQDREVRKKYLKLASFYHPDRAGTPHEAAVRTSVMQRLNSAYAANDLALLLQIEKEMTLEVSGDRDVHGDLSDELEREIKSLTNQLQDIETELKEIERDPMFRELSVFLRSEGDITAFADEVTGDLIEGIEVLEETKAHLLRYLNNEITTEGFLKGPPFDDEDEEALMDEFMRALYEHAVKSSKKAASRRKQSALHFMVKGNKDVLIELLNSHTLGELDASVCRAMKRRYVDHSASLVMNGRDVAILGDAFEEDNDLELSEVKFEKNTEMLYVYVDLRNERAYEYELIFLGKGAAEPGKSYPCVNGGATRKNVSSGRKR